MIVSDVEKEEKKSEDERSELVATSTTGPGTDVFGGGKETDGLEATGEVGTNGRGDHEEERRAGGSNTKRSLGTDHRGSEVK